MNSNNSAIKISMTIIKVEDKAKITQVFLTIISPSAQHMRRGAASKPFRSSMNYNYYFYKLYTSQL